MYIILVYDVYEARVGKVNKYLKKYLLWRQNSVFEGEISDTLIEQMIKGLKKDNSRYGFCCNLQI